MIDLRPLWPPSLPFGRILMRPVSMFMSSVVKLRIINTAGSVISGIYALISGAFPLFVMNICIIVINIYNLIKLMK